MANTRIKICGITTPEDAAMAAEAGADAIGLNFFAGPRKISLGVGRQILALMPPLVTPVALTSGPTTEFPDAPTIDEIRAGEISYGQGRLPIRTFQLYGDPTLALPSDSQGLAYWPVYHFTGYAGLCACPWWGKIYPQLVVVDKAVKGSLGGTGQTLDWQAVADAQTVWYSKDLPRIVLAGGLNPDNVAEAIRIARPYTVDVSSGVEFPGKPGVKDAARVKAFVEAVRGA